VTLEALLIDAPPARQLALIRDALAALGDSEPYLEARLLGRLAFPSWDNALGAEETERVARRAAALVDAHGFEDVQALLLAGEASRAFSLTEFERSAALYGQAYELFARLGRPNEAARALFLGATCILVPGRLDEGKAATERALAYAHDHHIRWFEDNSAAFLAGLMFARCDFAGFETLVEERAADVGYPIPLLKAWRAEMEGDHERALTLLPDPAIAGGFPMYLSHILAARARVMFNAGHIERARQEFTRLREAMQAHPSSTIHDGVSIEGGALQYLDEALTHVADDAFMEAVEKYIRRWRDAPTPPFYYPVAAGCLARIYAAIALHRGLIDDAAERYRRSLAWCEREGCPIEAGRCLQGLAEVSERRGERAEALQLLDRAAALFQQHGARLYLDRVIAKKLELQGISSSDIHTSIDAVAASVQRERPEISVHPAPDGTVTIMFSDIEGSTQLTERLGDKAWMEVLREHNVIVRKQVKSHGGFEVKSEGDGFMVAFQSARKALECAVAIERTLATRNQTAAEPVLVRMGLHAGEVIKEGEDFFGRNVIMAARVASQAQGGEVLASGVLKALVEGSDVVWGEARALELKGFSGTHEIWPVAWRD
jgi:class 3 adenylate cyclase